MPFLKVRRHLEPWEVDGTIAEAMSSRDTILAKLHEHASELRPAGLLHVSLFGSASRNESTQDSDIDLLADFDANTPLTLLRVSRLQTRLSELLGAKVDLSVASWLKESIRERILKESIRAF